MSNKNTWGGDGYSAQEHTDTLSVLFESKREAIDERIRAEATIDILVQSLSDAEKRAKEYLKQLTTAETLLMEARHTRKKLRIYLTITGALLLGAAGEIFMRSESSPVTEPFNTAKALDEARHRIQELETELKRTQSANVPPEEATDSMPPAPLPPPPFR